MKKFLKILFILITFSGCTQNTALLGPALSVATSGSINQALLSGSINTGIKHQTGKSVSEHMVQSLEQNLDCSNYNSNELTEVFFVNYSDIDCYSQNIK
tara:strand:- start:130 stop:426 length:297 start_codon:yes stop_codon:yes gene_type:complete